jgi:hypothetical protein
MSGYGNRNTYGSTSTGSQVLYSFIILIVVSTLIYFIKFIYLTITSKSLRLVTLLDETYSSSGNMKIIQQDPRNPDSIPIGISVNERTGIEFAYSFFLYVDPKTFTGEDDLKHIFHKGYDTPWPLMGPGVFMRGLTNTMRIVMNTQTNPYSYIDITNIPIQKWVHVVLNCYKNGLDIYINGGLASRMPLTNTIPYQNFQNIFIFHTSVRKLNKANIAVLQSTLAEADTGIKFNGPMSGQISSLKYARYALSINEINALMGQGPSKKVVMPTNQMPPYNGDTWWVEQQGSY